ncbi:MAG: hypothetical protein Q9195_002298 [Heterodermia aff. obscurata]
MASTTLAQLSRLDLLDLSIPASASITDFKHLSSYNWIEATTPTIAVPGSPALWSPLSTPRMLNKDSSLIYIAQNAARHPDSPLEPLFRALYTTNPSFDIRSTDIVTDRNNIRKLLSFINPSSAKNGLEAFTINIELAKNTAIFSRAETATQEFIHPGEFRGYGHEFEKAYTTSQLKGSTGHHRIISYRFGDLNFIVRHETDGYVASPTSRAIPSSSSSKDPGSDVLSSMLGSLSLSPPTPPTSKLTVTQAGTPVPLSSTLEIKTRVAKKPLEDKEVMPQLWVSQTPKLVRAYHTKGIFPTPVVEDMTAGIKSWEEANQTHLRRLAALIHWILRAVRGGGGRRAYVRYEAKGGKLVVGREGDGGRMLPGDLYGKWEDGGEVDAEGETAAKSLDGVEGKSVGAGVGDAKGKKAGEVVGEEEHALPDNTLPNPTAPEKDTGLGSQDKGGKRTSG